MSLIAGTLTKLVVSREVSPYGYFLDGGDRDVLLHYSELTGKIEPGIRSRSLYSSIRKTAWPQR